MGELWERSRHLSFIVFPFFTFRGKGYERITSDDKSH